MTGYRCALFLSTIVAASTFVTAQSTQSGANDAPVSIYSLVPSPQQPEPAPPAVRSPAPAAQEGADPAGLVHLSVTVTDDKGKPITNLTKADFVVLEDGQAREIATFVGPRPGELTTPMGLGIVMDISAGQDRITSMRTPVEDLLKKLGKDSEFYFMEFSTLPTLVTPWTTDHEAIVTAIRRVRGKEGRALHDAILDALPVSAKGTRQKRVMLVLTAGADSHSKANRPRLMEGTRAADVMVYTVIADGEESLSGRDTGALRQAAGELREVTNPTGGRTIHARGFDELETAIADLGKEFAAQYEISFPRGAAKDGKYHQIRVGARGQNLTIRHRAGYIAN